ncbi:DUF1513 domain-containing protein [Dongia soli]|uniref:DUF1513 domain-containing protein n=1 Tax=Dongia soli TaxID=600628 RepID=A0ABU5EF15_9PROT|nr:DUF1513 domain-containing protein [Dongia soli]MDY0884983.1 DUF1513 domain-containing protein [Dongia soli]
MDRHHFLSGSLQSFMAGIGATFGRQKAKVADTQPRFLSACGVADKGGKLAFAAAAIDGNGDALLDSALPMRAHEIALHPDGRRVLAVGRQPGRYSCMIDLADGRKLYDLQIADDHEFNGHAVFPGEGAQIIATEEHVETSIGRLGFYDAATGAWLQGWPSHGIEPHEAILDEKNNRLIVANGGILQRHAVGEVESSLVILDLRDGEPIAIGRLPEDLASLSMRHMALTARGDVVCGMQDQDAQSDLRPLVCLLDPAGNIRFLKIPRDLAMILRGYVGSVAVDISGWVACATSPKGNVAMFWDLRRETWLGQATVADGCGVAGNGKPGGFVVTGGKGDVVEIATLDAAGRPMAPKSHLLASNVRWHWDNHLTRIRA